MVMSNKPSVLYAFARSGGTLVNRCLGCIPGNLILSEINPHASVISIEQQALDWLKLLAEYEIPAFSRKPYVEKIFYLQNLAQAKGCNLIIRDWCSVNFLSNPIESDILVPSFVLEQKTYLQHYEFHGSAVVVSRRAADVYESITRSFQHLQNLNIEDFGESYLKYAAAVSNYPIIHYERICTNPKETISKICNLLGINYDESFIFNFSRFENCTGDTNRPQPSRGIQLESIRPLRSYTDSPNYIAASKNENCQKADELLGYAN